MSKLRRFLTRETPFSYACQGCGRCCHGKRITLSPYELARLARAAKLSTRELLERHTDEAGTALRFTERAGCTFLVGGRCSVHEGRPLSCRLYPLGRFVRENEEAFVELEPHPETEGVYGEDSTVAAWVERSEAKAFIDRASQYHARLARMATLLNAREGGPSAFEEALHTDDDVASDWLDVDEVIARACQRDGCAAPTELEARIDLHLAELDRWLAALERGEESASPA